MRKYILLRLLYMVITLLLVSFVAFMVIQLPPGDYMTVYFNNLQQQMGGTLGAEDLEALRTQYGLDSTPIEQYGVWMKNILTRWDFGQSLGWKQPVNKLIAERVSITILISPAHAGLYLCLRHFDRNIFGPIPILNNRLWCDYTGLFRIINTEFSTGPDPHVFFLRVFRNQPGWLIFGAVSECSVQYG